MYNMKDITVILPIHEFTADTAKWLKMSVNSVNLQVVKPEKFIIVYNPSIEKDIKNSITDEEISSIKDIIEYLPNTSNEFDFCSQINFATEHVKTEYFSFLEFDDEYSRIWFKNVKKYIEAYPEVEMFLPIVVDTDEKGVFAGFTNEATFAANFSQEMAYLTNDVLQSYQNFQTSGSVIKKRVVEDFGGFKSSMKLTFIYEFLLRLTYNSVSIMTIPRLGYKHTNLREGSIFWNYKYGENKILEDEVKFWLETAKKEYFFTNDRSIKYQE